MRLEIRNELAAIGPACEQAETWLGAEGAGPEAAMFVSLAIEELVSNCIKYGYDDAAVHCITCELALEAGQLTLVIEDDGHPFDPVQAVQPDLTLPVEERPIGGLGLHLLREMSDAMHYQRKGGRNVITLVKTL